MKRGIDFMKKHGLSSRRKIYIGTMKWLMRICAGLTFGLVIFLIAYVFIKGILIAIYP